MERAPDSSPCFYQLPVAAPSPAFAIDGPQARLLYWRLFEWLFDIGFGCSPRRENREAGVTPARPGHCEALKLRSMKATVHHVGWEG
jgi:hypothetical protein